MSRASRSGTSLAVKPATARSLEEAAGLFRNALEAETRVHGADGHDVLESMGNLAAVYTAQGRHDQAEPLYERVLEARRRLLGADHPGTLAAMENLAIVYENRGRNEEGGDLRKEALEARRRVLGAEHVDTLRSMGYLAYAYQLQGRDREAERLYEEAHPRSLQEPAFTMVWNMLFNTNLRRADSEALRGYLHRYRKPPEGQDALYAKARAAYEKIGKFIKSERHLVSRKTMRKYRDRAFAEWETASAAAA